jgi:hypothetical protein
MNFLILIPFGRSVLILALGDEQGAGDLSRRLAALRFWPARRHQRAPR